jgi:hypothetical protein
MRLLTPLETLGASVLFAVVVVPATGAVIELPAIVVTGRASKPPDIVSRDRDQRSQDIHWPPALSIRWSEMFAHNEIEINAPCATVWNHLIQAYLWSQWCPDVGKVKVSNKDGSQTLRMNTRFTWSGFDLGLDTIALPAFQVDPPFASKVNEYVPESRLGWVSYTTAVTPWGPLCDAYHNWLLTPTSANKCHVVLEAVATGLGARHARGVYPEIAHMSHQRWLEQLKKISESRASKGIPLASQF